MTALATTQALAVALGAAGGALVRWRANVWLNGITTMPLGTLLVNCAGGVLAGAALAYFARGDQETLRLFAVTGFLGGLTTFSAFSAESLSFLQRGLWALAVTHTLVHVLGALACAALGYALARVVMGAPA